MTRSLIPSLLSYKLQMNVGEAALIAILGLAIVFAVLAVLVALLTLFKVLFNLKITKKTPQKTEVQPSAAVTATAPFRIKSVRRTK